MAKKVGINAWVGANIKQFSTAMQNVRRDMDKTKGSLSKSSLAMKTGIAAVGTTLLAMATASVKAASDMQGLEMRLKTAFEGNELAARKALREVNEFTAKTPFQLDQVADGFIQLKNRGLDPSMDSMRAIGDMAAAMGKDFETAVQAVAQATVGEMEMLKQFGITAKQQGDQVSFTFKGVTTTVKKESGAIQKYLMELSKANFAGGMEAQSKTLAGQLSTLKDNIKLLAADLGAIFIPIISKVVGKLVQFAGWLKNLRGEQDGFQKNLAKEKAMLTSLFSSLKNANVGSKRRAELIKEINEKYGEYLPKQLSERDNLLDIEKAQVAANAALLKSVYLKSRQEELANAEQRAMDRTASAMDKVLKLSTKASTKRSGFLKSVTEEEAFALQQGVLDLYDRFKFEGINRVKQEAMKMAAEMGVAFDNSKMFELHNSVAALYNAEADRRKELERINREYDRMAQLMGISADAASGLTKSAGGGVAASGGKADPYLGLLGTMKGKSFDGFNGLVGKSAKEIAKDFPKALDTMKDSFVTNMQEMARAGDQFLASLQDIAVAAKDALHSVAVDGFMLLADSMANLGQSGEKFGEQFMNMVAGVAKQLARMIIGMGVSLLAVPGMQGNALAMIAGGTALAAIAGAATTQSGGATAQTTNVEVQGAISGGDIVLVSDRYRRRRK